ncbi:hypothetical protein vec25_04 [Escherichia phage VEc25]|uniref:Uncharacterized protein n=1 Tax=Escherichia phage VEc25 TaxID=2794959 RepID=A0A7T1NCS3_9CAUD|nr:hypothetical protein vec25_04 [Escherichia phage VEc25]
MSYEIVKHWTSKAGLKAWVLLVNGGSHHCGYVEIPEALLDKNFYDYICDGEETLHIAVHGGVTYQGVPQWADGIKVIGYDCAHAGDKLKCPKQFIGSLRERLYEDSYGVWRDEEYCINECESMADQLINLIPKLGFNDEIQNSNG